MSDKTENYFAALQPRPTDIAQMDIDGIGSCINAITSNLDKLHPDKQGIFGKMAEQLTTHLNRLREARISAYDYFIGKGPVARKLREHLKADDWMNPQNRARNQDLTRRLEMSFNKYPTRDELELKELQDFIQLTLPLMGGHVDGTEFKPYDGTSTLTELPSGFYKMKGVMLEKHMLILNTRLTPANIGVVYVLVGGTEEQLMFQHDDEGEWFRSDYSFTFANLVSELRAELDNVIVPLGLSALKSDLQPQLDEVFKKVDFIFENHQRLPEESPQFVMQAEEQTTITVPIGDFYKWTFTDTRGQWPTRIKRFTIQVGSTEQTATPGDMNEFSRQNMVKSLHVVLDNIIGALAPATAQAA